MGIQRAYERWGRFGMLAAVLVVGLGMSFVVFPSSAHRTDRYRQVCLQRGPLTVNLVATGVVQPQNRVAVKPPINGRVEQLLVQEGDGVKKGQILAWMSSTERAALLDAAQARGPQELREWESFYRPTPILAPIDGSIIQGNVQSGQSFTSSDAVFVLSDRLTVKTLVDETDIAQIGKGQAAAILLDAYPDEKLSGRADHIAFDAKTINSITTYEVDVVPDRAPSFLRSGMTANVTFEIASKTGVLLVPAEAVRVGEGRTTVLTPPAAPGLNPSPKTIHVGVSDGKSFEVIDGLKPGDVVLIPEIRYEEPEEKRARGLFAPNKGNG